MHFLKIAQGLDVLPLLLALRQQPALWGRSARCTVADSPYRELLDCVLRCPVEGTSEDPRECVWLPAWACLPQARPLVYGLLARVEAERLGRVVLTWNVPGSMVYPHCEPERYWSRYVVVLESNEECGMACDDGSLEEVVCMRQGEAWWVNSTLPQSSWNKGQTDALHLLLDVHGSQCGG